MLLVLHAGEECLAKKEPLYPRAAQNLLRRLDEVGVLRVLFIGDTLFLFLCRSLTDALLCCLYPLFPTVQDVKLLVILGYLAEVVEVVHAESVAASLDNISEIVAQEAVCLAVQGQGRLEFCPESLVGILACNLGESAVFAAEASLSEVECLLPKRLAPSVETVASGERGMFLE